MECPFVVGQKVVCVDDSTTWPVKLVHKGQIYTVHEVAHVMATNGVGQITSGVDVRINEVMFNPINGNRMWFKPRRFRPVEYQTSIESLRAHLTASHKQVEDA